MFTTWGAHKYSIIGNVKMTTYVIETKYAAPDYHTALGTTAPVVRDFCFKETTVVGGLERPTESYDQGVLTVSRVAVSLDRAEQFRDGLLAILAEHPEVDKVISITVVAKD